MSTCEQRKRRGGMWEDKQAETCRFPIAPINTVSNLAYPLAGAAVVLIAPSFAAGVFASAMLFLGFGSAYYHGAKTGVSARWDYAGMYAVFAALATYAVAPDRPGIALLMMLAAAVAAYVFAFRLARVDLRLHMGVFLSLGLVGAVARGGYLFAGGSLAVFALSWWAWNLDKRDPSPLGRWGHGLWHIGTAGAIALMFLAQSSAT